MKIKLFLGGKPPVRATDGSAGYDLFARVAATHIPSLQDREWHINVLAAGPTFTDRTDAAGNPAFVAPVVRIPLGVGFAIPEGYVGLLCARSSTGGKGLVIPNGLGIIDSDYRGEVQLALMNLSGEDFIVRDGDRLAQILFVPVLTPSLAVVDELPETARGEGGFGSTGEK